MILSWPRFTPKRDVATAFSPVQEVFAHPTYAETWRAIEWMHEEASLSHVDTLMMAMYVLVTGLLPPELKYGKSHGPTETLIIHAWISLSRDNVTDRTYSGRTKA